MASVEEKSDQFTRMEGQPDPFDSVYLAQISKNFSRSGKIAKLIEKSDQFTRMAGQPDLFASVELAQITNISQIPGKWPL